MSYCVNCGVELDHTAGACPLCHTKVYNPNQPVDTQSPTPFPQNRSEVPPVSRKELALLITAMLLSVGVCCGVLNLFFLRPDVNWSLYVIGAAAMLWFWLVPHLILRTMPVWLRLAIGTVAIGGYVALIAYELDGWNWYLGLAAPIVLLFGGFQLGIWLAFQEKRSILTRMTSLIGLTGIFLLGLEYLIDHWALGRWEPGWSIVVAAVCVSLIIPLLVIRHRPSLRDEVRRRFHL